mmetsp:Transcript_29075/g.42449  ORF Transcript_29075/g.42449 Transcript_29075/m.42449 type:complete len:671 (-) Transcript_29075:393-2405(-)
MGNRVKGRVKKKSIKAASHSSMGSKRKLSRMGKKRKAGKAGLEATFIGRSACVKRLQITLKDFRRLCILKGIYPREPRGRTPGNKKGQVYYHIKDVRAIAHEPILEKFREFRAFMKKVRKAAGRNEKDEASRKEKYAPTYTLHHLVRERYPRFGDALNDLDDALTLVYLFAALPSEKRIKTTVTQKAKRLAASWGAYCATSSSVTKSFVSVKGVYFEANILGSTIRWIVPHSFTQNVPPDVDYRVMLTFFEFYETLLGFVLFKLYSDMGVRYPLPITSADQSGFSSLLAANLHVLSREVRSAKGSVSSAVREAVENNEAESATNEGEVDEADTKEKKDLEKKEAKARAKKSRDLIKSVDVALNRIADDSDDDNDEDSDADDDGEEGEGSADLGAPLKAALESITMEEQNTGSGTEIASSMTDEATKRRRLFAGLTFFISREVPRGYLELICLSYGGKVGWEGEDSPISVKDASITHHIVDRPKLPSSYNGLPSSREYVQPQWILDCANFHFLLPCARYGIGTELPPHLSPWVNDEEEGYKPAYAEEVEKMKNGEVLEDMDEVSDENDEKEDISPTEYKKEEEEDDDDEEGEEEEDEDEEEEKKRSKKRKNAEDEEAKELAKVMMSKKASRLYGRMQHGLAQKQAKVDELHRRRKEIDSKKQSKKRKNSAE